MSDGRNNSAMETRRTNGIGGRPETDPSAPKPRRDPRADAFREAKRAEALAAAANEAVAAELPEVDPGKCSSCGRKKVTIAAAVVGRDGEPGAELCGPGCYAWRLYPLPAAR